MSITEPLLLIAATALAAIIGFVNQHGGTCTVADIHDLVERKPGRIIAVAECSLWAFGCGVLLKMAGWSLPPVADLSVGVNTIAGAALLGFGAWLNKACLFGTLTQVGRRNLNYLFTPIGLYAGFVLHALVFATPAVETKLYQPNMMVQIAAGLLFAMTVLSHAFGWYRRSRVQPTRAVQFGHREALVVHALAFTLTANMVGPWTYGELLSRYAHGGASPDFVHLVLVLALIMGALLGGWRTAQTVTFAPSKAVICFIGGAMMAIGSALVPGGNDMLILYGAPLLQWHAIAAIAMMLLTIALCIVAQKFVSSLHGKIRISGH